MQLLSAGDIGRLAVGLIVGLGVLAIAAAVLLKGWWKALGAGLAALALVVLVQRQSFEHCVATQRGCSECLCDFFFLQAGPGEIYPTGADREPSLAEDGPSDLDGRGPGGGVDEAAPLGLTQPTTLTLRTSDNTGS